MVHGLDTVPATRIFTNQPSLHLFSFYEITFILTWIYKNIIKLVHGMVHVQGEQGGKGEGERRG